MDASAISLEQRTRSVDLDTFPIDELAELAAEALDSASPASIVPAGEIPWSIYCGLARVEDDRVLSERSKALGGRDGGED